MERENSVRASKGAGNFEWSDLLCTIWNLVVEECDSNTTNEQTDLL